jgi:hypothetical protein
MGWAVPSLLRSASEGSDILPKDALPFLALGWGGIGAVCSNTQPLYKTAHYLAIPVDCEATHCQRPFFLTNTSLQRSSLLMSPPLYFPL